MCQMSMKLPATLDQNPPHTFDNTGKTDYKKKCFQSLTFSLNIKSLQKSKDNDLGTKNIAPPKNLSRLP